MKKESKILVLVPIIMLFIFLSSISSVYADMGPKPTANIYVYYNGHLVSENAYSRMVSCTSSRWVSSCEESWGDACAILNISIRDNQGNCTWKPDPLAWGGECIKGICHFSYFLPENFKFIVYIPSLNKTFITNEITQNNFDAIYRVYIVSKEDSYEASIIDKTPLLEKDFIKSYLWALGLTSIIELFVWLVFFLIKKINKNMLWIVLLANVISLSLIWFVLLSIKNFSSHFFIYTILAEIFVIIFESLFIFYLTKKAFSLGASFIVSLIANIASIFMGGFIYGFLSIFLRI